MTVSVAMATYNGAQYIGAQLESLAAQTRLPDELVVCDDGSTDATLDILDAFAAAAPFPVRIYQNESNLGSTKNFEKAVTLCTGDFIALCDQDDVWLPEKLARCESALLENPKAGLVFTDGYVVGRDLSKSGYTIWQSIYFDASEQARLMSGEYIDVLMQRNVVTGAALMFRAQFRDIIMPFSNYWVHDAWIAILIALAAEIIPLPEPLMLYRLHGGNQIGLTVPTEADKNFSFKPGAWRQFDFGRNTSWRYNDEAEAASKPRTKAKQRRQRPPLRQRIAKARVRDPYRTRALAMQGAPFYEHLMQLEKKWHVHMKLQVFADFTKHMQSRGYLPKSRLRRLPIVLRELVTGRYYRFSSGGMLPFGLSIAIADMLWTELVPAERSVWAKQYQRIRSATTQIPDLPEIAPTP